MTLTFKQIKHRGDVWGEMFRTPDQFAKYNANLDSYGYKYKLMKNARYYKFTFYVGGFGHVTRRKTKYGKAFLEKQRMQLFYGSLPDKQLRFLWKSAAYKLGITEGIFLHFMESLIHVVAYRANFAFNVQDAKMLVEAGFFEVNSQRVTSLRRLKVGDVLTIYHKKYMLKFFKFLLELGFKFFPAPVHLIPDYRLVGVCYIGFEDGDIPFYPVRTQLQPINQIYY
jgi:ribosomal protein S4